MSPLVEPLYSSTVLYSCSSCYKRCWHEYGHATRGLLRGFHVWAGWMGYLGHMARERRTAATIGQPRSRISRTGAQSWWWVCIAVSFPGRAAYRVMMPVHDPPGKYALFVSHLAAIQQSALVGRLQPRSSGTACVPWCFCQRELSPFVGGLSHGSTASWCDIWRCRRQIHDQPLHCAKVPNRLHQCSCDSKSQRAVRGPGGTARTLGTSPE